MANRDDFTDKTKRVLAERAGQQCSNPNCGHSTAGPSDADSKKSTLLGKAAHITAAAEGGPRYDAKLTSEERKSPENGIWLCAECADRVDKKENEHQFPVELLKHWKQFNESVTGTDYASLQDRAHYPVRKLRIVDFGGVIGDITINFGALTLFYGTSKLNQSVCDLLRTFSEREKFEQTRQPRSGVRSWNYGIIPIVEKISLGVTVLTSEPRYFAEAGKLHITLSDAKDFVVRTTTDDVAIFVGDAPLPVFSPVLNIVTIRKNFESVVFSGDSEEEFDDIRGLSTFFGVSVKEIRDCIQGVASDISLFNYNYKLENESNLLIKLSHNRDFLPIRVLSSGELKRFILDMAIRVATYSSRVRPTVMTINQSYISSLDARGWADFLEWVEKSRPPFQVVADCCYRPSEGDLSRALCYDAVGTDMAVTSFGLRTWAEFQKAESEGAKGVI
ncbi:hypothetical protein F6V30_07720 [Oryzomonas sagensis]|uniref:HNH endonuclease n=1 Tax=Oryzomonas sagensis TaxID=2603857 RepID=A0ABQ6TU31_9BACT|nr:hypothetical protein [Oryzomonas sagensis]KAB0672440.1 hypothetical protein F6V30_07720 [Oryzomonas sagensis]